MRRSMAILAGCLLTTTAAAEPSLKRFGGDWSGAGSFQGAPSTVNARFAPLYDGKFWTLDVEVGFADPAGKPASFNGRATYPVTATGLRTGDWIDSAGNDYAIEPTLENDVLVVLWKDGAGKSEYRIEPDGDLRIEDFARGAGKRWRRFAHAELKRR
jgi:hypothetical protein